MRLGPKWSTTILMGVVAGTGAAIAATRRRTGRPSALPPASSLGVDGLGEAVGIETAPDEPSTETPIVMTPDADDLDVVCDPHPAAVADDLAALEEARQRLRRSAEQRIREMDGTGD